MKSLVIFLIAFISLSCNSQQKPPKFNLDFEQNKLHQNLPDQWFKWGTYAMQKDTVNVYSGKYSALIASDENGSSFGSVAYRIPAKYTGRVITLQGYMKIENVGNGFAGLLLRIDGHSGTLAFDNMQNQQIHGTSDWKKYSITLPYPAGAEYINVAGILSGKGKAWFDDFTLTIDGKDVQTLPEVEKPLSKVEKDTEFDKGSDFQLREVNQEQAAKLYKLCKVWGFLKYYHPTIAKGEVNWDYELFRFLPKLNSPDFNQEVLKWIDSLGNVSGKSPDEPDSAKVKLWPDIKWISDESFLGKEVSQKLNEIRQASREKSNYYVSLFPNVGNPDFQAENPYQYIQWDDTGYRLLALFRYWNMIEYFSPNRDLPDKNWNEVLREYIPKMVLCDSDLAYKQTLLSLIGEVNDTHANVWDPVLNQFFGVKTAPIEVRFVENKAVVVAISTQLGNDSHIKVGDVITKINGVETRKLADEKIDYCPASNYPTKLRDVAGKLIRTNDSTINLTLENGSKTYSEKVKTVLITKVNLWKRTVSSYSEIGKDIGYIYPGTLKKGEIDTIMKSFITKKSIIIDLRCYPSDFIVFSLGKYLMPKPTKFVKFTAGSLSSPGLFTFTEPLKVGTVNADYFKGKVAILINEKTQSQAEYTAMALRVAPKARVFGSTTAGADGNVSKIFLPGNIQTMISGIGVYYPDGTQTQRVGIVPDVEIKPTIVGIRSEKDEVLEKAEHWINE